MALIKCKECGKEISDKAPACPHCGAPNKPKPDNKSSSGCLTVIIILGVIGILGAIGQYGGSSSEPSTPRETVYNSSWDGSVYQAEAYLKRNLKDPDSYESIEWGKVAKNSDGNYITWCKYRAKNSFGGYMVNKHMFILSPSGDVLSMHEIGN